MIQKKMTMHFMQMKYLKNVENYRQENNNDEKKQSNIKNKKNTTNNNKENKENDHQSNGITIKEHNIYIFHVDNNIQRKKEEKNDQQHKNVLYDLKKIQKKISETGYLFDF